MTSATASISSSQVKTIAQHLRLNAQQYPDAPAVHSKVGDGWQSVNWSQYGKAVQSVSRSLMATGHARGDTIAVLAGNRFEWFCSLVGASNAGVIPVGVYSTNAAVEVAYVVQNSGTKTIIVENSEQLAKVHEEWANMPSLERAILLEGDTGEDARVISWDAFLKEGESITDEALETRESSVSVKDTGALIYTSGTTQSPKGVLLSNEALSFTAGGLGQTINATEKDVLLSYLPLAHVAEQLVSVHIAVRQRYQVFICAEPLQLADYIKSVRPTIFFGVPRVWERFHAALTGKFALATGGKAKMLAFAQAAGTARSNAIDAGRSLSVSESLRYKVAEKLVFSKLREAMGLDRAHTFLTGAAPTPGPVAELFSSLGMELHEVYGQTEGTACTTANTHKHSRKGTVGRAIQGTEMKIAEDGEVIFRGACTMTGYLGNEEATAETLVDGWIHTGDLGTIDDDGFLTIVGRKKDIIINSSGKNIAPKAVEGLLTSLSDVSQAVCVGEGQRFLVALLTLDPERAESFASENGCDVSEVAEHPDFRALVAKAIEENVNANLARVEHIRNFRILPQPFSPENGETTVTFKIKRNVVVEKYDTQVQAMYEEGQIL